MDYDEYTRTGYPRYKLFAEMSNRIQVRPPFASKADPPAGV